MVSSKKQMLSYKNDKMAKKEVASKRKDSSPFSTGEKRGIRE
jgi:hypothetical protein